MREHLVVVVPGIGGSVLAPSGEPDKPVWSAGWSDRRLLRHPEMLSLNVDLEPVGLIRSLKPVPFWTAVTGYEGLLAALGHPHPTVLPAPYDFRKGVVPAAEQVANRVQDRLGSLWPGEDHTGRVIVVAHSMGGLIARHWIGVGDGSACCKALITLGTPHWGAPKALDVLANGIRVGGVPVWRRLREVLRTWPSMAELLPCYQAVVDVREPHRGGTGGLLYPHELPLPWQQWGADPGAAYRMHRQIETGWEGLPRSGTQVVPRIGYGHGTLRACTWDGQVVRVSTDPPTWPELGKWDPERGDGTVPAYAGLPAEMRQPPEDFLVPSRHGQLGALKEVAALVARYEGRGQLWPYRGVERPTHPAVLGLDIDEVQAAGQPVMLGGAIHGDGVDASKVAMWARVTGAEGDRPVGADVQLARDAGGGAYREQMPPLAPGAYTLHVTAREVPGAGDLETAQTFEVFDDADLE